MSDTPSDEAPRAPTQIRYEDRTREEMEALESSFRSYTTGGINYVAKPADGWNVEGLWHCFDAGSRSGYAAHAIALHWCLDKHLDLPTQLVPHRNLDIDIEKFPKDRYDMLFGWNKNAVGIPKALFCSFPPEVAAELSGGTSLPRNMTRAEAGMGPPLVPYCAFEGDKVSTYCRDLCNGDAFEEVWVVSDFVRDSMIAGGVYPDRVYTIPPAICDGPWQMLDPYEAQDLRRVENGDIYTFGYMGTWHSRKGMHDLLRAYFSTFKREEPVRLVISTSSFGKHVFIRELKEQLTKEIAKIAAEFGDDDFPRSQKMPRLQLKLGTSMTDAEVIRWLASLDCYANASYGEGLGIPAVWAKANGAPVVTASYGAVWDMVRNIERPASYSSLFRVDEIVPSWMEPVDPEMIKIGLMFDPDTKWGRYEPAMYGAAMRNQFNRLGTFDSHGANDVRRKHSMKSMAAAVEARLDKKNWR